MANGQCTDRRSRPQSPPRRLLAVPAKSRNRAAEREANRKCVRPLLPCNQPIQFARDSFGGGSPRSPPAPRRSAAPAPPEATGRPAAAPPCILSKLLGSPLAPRSISGCASVGRHEPGARARQPRRRPAKLPGAGGGSRVAAAHVHAGRSPGATKLPAPRPISGAARLQGRHRLRWDGRGEGGGSGAAFASFRDKLAERVGNTVVVVGV